VSCVDVATLNWLAGASSAWWALFLSSAATSSVRNHHPSADIHVQQHATTFLKHVNLIFELKEASSTMLLVRLRHGARVGGESGTYTFSLCWLLFLLSLVCPAFLFVVPRFLFCYCRGLRSSLLSRVSFVVVVCILVLCRVLTVSCAIVTLIASSSLSCLSIALCLPRSHLFSWTTSDRCTKNNTLTLNSITR
jgi:hypothetical protein